MKLSLITVFAVVLVAHPIHGADNQTRLDLEEAHKAAAEAKSLFLDSDARVRAVDTFVDLVRIKGVSGQEQTIRSELKAILLRLGAHEIPSRNSLSNAPLNLVMEIAATGALTNAPAIILNAHIDTVAWSTPELMVFDTATDDFFHKDETGESSSFGGDDRSSVATLVETMRLLRNGYWSRGVAHRRVVLIFTADEERGCVGAKYLRDHEAELFANVDVTLSMDGPLDLRSGYPQNSLTAVVANKDATIQPYKKVLDLMQDYCGRRKVGFGRTEYGLGFGDFAYFPASAHAGLHIRSPVRGWHNKERVKVQDLINHVDILCFILLAWDDALPAKLGLKNP